ncbi:MAG TPA: VOC family protein [Polyangiaceae bacterium]|jgi:catechol 2,3-dioxygenase-like lactoylglutathione lyase family enzyme|nr:VOC family protein [Polyangiaceae bacterium]
MTIDVHLDGLTLSVASVRRSMKFYSETLGFKIVVDAAPDFALVRVGGKRGSIGLLALKHAVGGKVKRVAPAMRAGAHVELSTNDLDGLYEKLRARGVEFDGPPHDEPWERLAWARDPDGYTLEFAQGERAASPKARTRKKA